MLDSHNRVHGRKLVSVEGGDCSKRCIVYFAFSFLSCLFSVFFVLGLVVKEKQGPPLLASLEVCLLE